MTKTKKPPITKLSTIQAGISGEYFVAAELSRRGYVASLTLRNTRGIDVLASNTDATTSVGIQVKTSRGTRPVWLLSKKAEADVATNLYYVFVRLPPAGLPIFHVVPRVVVAKFVRDSHREWLQSPGARGQAHRDTDMRQFADADGTYVDRWDLLGLG